MKKKCFNEVGMSNFLKVLRIMRLSAFLLLVFALQTWAAPSYSQQSRVTLKLDNVKVLDVLSEIERSTRFYFLFNKDLVDIERRVSVSAYKEEIDKVLNELFRGTNVNYVVSDRQIVLTTEKESNVLVQQMKVTGKVTDSNGQPLPGVTVVVKGTTNGTVTNADGEYLLANVSGDATLQFSFVGMKTQEIQIEGRFNINVTMEVDEIGIEEVVAIGYGTIKKKDLTGSVGSVQGAELSNKKSTIKINDALQGTIPGVTVTRTSGEPGSVGTIRVRGITTIEESEPIVIVDGVQGTLESLNAEDVESISVLKDAASASIYGSKAAAGVIVVTTKRGKTGELSLKYDVQYGVSQPTRLPQMARAVQYMKMVNELVWNDVGNTGSEYSRYSQELIENYPALHADNPDLYPDTDWTTYLRDYAPRQNHSLSFSAGAQMFSTYGSVSYDHVQSIVSNRPFDNFTARINNDIKINKIVSASLDFQYLYSYDQRTQTTPSAALFDLEPTETAFWSDGRVADFRNGDNLWAKVLRGGTNKKWNNQVTGRVALNITPVKNLKFSGIFSPNFSFYKNKKHLVAIPMTAWDDPDVITGYVNGYEATSLSEVRNDSKNFTTQALAEYVNTFGKHSLTFLTGYEYYYYYYETLGASRSQYTLDDYPYLDLGPLDYRDNSGSAVEYASRSYFGRVIYSIADKYLFQANARYDGSSRFAKNYRYGLFPSVSVGWVISEEPFFKSFEHVSSLKLRVSYGTLGNERIGSYYPYQSTIAYDNALFYSSDGTVLSEQDAYLSSYAIEDITWETTKTFDIGVDANFFDNKLQIVADYYKKNTSDMLLELEIPNYIGLEDPEQNAGSMSTKGWEFAITYRNNIGDFKYSASLNLSDFKSIMGDLGGTEFLGSQVKFEGSEYNEWYGYIAEGIYQTEEEVSNSATTSDVVQPGDIKYKDISGADGVPDGTISSEYDRVLLGGSLPRYEYGGNIKLEYANFDLSLIFQGVGKVNKFLDSEITYPLSGGSLSVPEYIVGDYWSNYNTAEQNLEVHYPRLTLNSATNNYSVMSNYWLINGGYFRLKNIVIGYSIPKKYVHKLSLENVRIYGNITDLFSIDKYPKGWDPEGAVDEYFINRSFILGASVEF